MRSARQALRRESGAMQQDFRRLGQSSAAASAQIGGISAAAASARAALGAFGIAIGAVGLLNFARNAITTADAIAKTADRIGVGIESLQELRVAAERAGATTGQLDAGLEQLTRRLGEAAAGKGELLQVLRQYGIEIRDAEGRTRSTEQVLADLADAMQRAGSASEQLRIAQAAFGRGGIVLANTLRNGSGALQEQRDRARELGLVLSEDAARGAEKANDALAELGSYIKVNLQGAFLEIAPEIRSFAESIVATFQRLKQLSDLLEPLIDFRNRFTASGISRAMTSGVDDLIARGSHIREQIEVFQAEMAEAAAAGHTALATQRREQIRLFEQDLAEIEARIEALGTVPPAGATDSPPPPLLPPPPPDPDPDAAKRVAAIQRVIEALTHEHAQLGRNTEAQRYYDELRKAGIDSSHVAAETIRTLVESIHAETTAMEMLRKEREEMEQHVKVLSAVLQNEASMRQSALEREMEQIAERRDLLESARLADVVSLSEYHVLKEQLETEHQARLTEIEDDERKKRLALQQAEYRESLGHSAAFFGNLAAIVGAGGQKAFRVSKLLSIAQGLISTHEAAMSSYAWGAKIGGPPLGAAMMAVAYGAQLAQLAQLKGINVGSTSAGGIGGGLSPTPTLATDLTRSDAPRDIRITIEGEGLLSVSQVRDLIAQIGEQWGDGARIVVA